MSTIDPRSVCMTLNVPAAKQAACTTAVQSLLDGTSTLPAAKGLWVEAQICSEYSAESEQCFVEQIRQRVVRPASLLAQSVADRYRQIGVLPEQPATSTSNPKASEHFLPAYDSSLPLLSNPQSEFLTALPETAWGDCFKCSSGYFFLRCVLPY